MYNEYILDSKAEAGFKAMIANSGTKLFDKKASNSNLVNSLNYYLGKAMQNGQLSYSITDGKIIVRV